MNSAAIARRRRAIEAMGLGPVWIRRETMPTAIDRLPEDRRHGVDATRESGFRIVGVGVEQPECLVIADPPRVDDPRFGGPAGRLLDAMLASIGRSRAVDTRVVAVVDTGTDRASPSPADDGWRAALDRHVATLAPKVVLVVGDRAGALLRGADAARAAPCVLVVDGREIPMVVTYDPAHLIAHGGDKAAAWRDLCMVRRLGEPAASEPCR